MIWIRFNPKSGPIGQPRRTSAPDPKRTLGGIEKKGKCTLLLPQKQDATAPYRRGLKIFYVSDHASASLGGRQTAPGRAHVLAHVVDPGRRRNGTGDGRVGDDELEEEWSPVGAIELRRPWGQPMPVEMVEQVTLPERPVDDHRQATLGGERQEPRLGLAVDHVVRELDEVDRRRGHDFRQFLVAAAMGRGNADVADAAVGLPF